MSEKLKLRWWPESCQMSGDPDSGARRRRLTSSPALTSNIYHEQPFCSRDGERIALFRTFNSDPLSNGSLMLYDIAASRITYLEEGIRVDDIANAAWSGVLYINAQRGSERRVMRFDLNTLERDDLFLWDEKFGMGFTTISADERYGLSSARLAQQRFGIFRTDLHTGQTEMIHEGPYLCNPHLQFRLQSATRFLVQENRGCILDDEDNWLLSCDERGAGLYSLNRDGGDRRDFPVAPPLTPSTTGHECWIGDTDRVLVTLAQTICDGNKTGNIVEVSHERDTARVVFDSPLIWNHISASRCGRYFVADSYHDAGAWISIGSIASGNARVLCDAQTSGGGGQYSHAHPYLTSDNRHVVFNSDHTGLAQVCLAEVPAGFLESLD